MNATDLRYQPRRTYVDYQPVSQRYLVDAFAPEPEAHTVHVEAVKKALKGRGFPFYPSSAWTRP